VQDEWLKLSITVERTDGGVVDAELLRPRAWVEANGIRTGQLLPLNIAELQVAGFAHVTAIEPCPLIASGDGSVITGRFITRQVDTIARVEILGADGSIEVLEGTTIHPIWSLDRNDWVELGELQQGEQLLGRTGAATVLSVAVVNLSSAVYNIEVHGEHVYAVGDFGVLVHNTGPCSFITTASGTTVRIPHGWVVRVADNGKGLVAQAPGAAGNANMIRIMDATTQYPQGYVRYYNAFGQPVNPLTGKPGSLAQTHIDLSTFVGQWMGFPT
jgi:hypothetical protein